MLSKLWAKITNADERTHTPKQQVATLGAVSDVSVVNPYGFYCDLPDGTLVAHVKDDAVIGVTQKRPDDTARGEPTMFHPQTNTRIVARNNGDFDILVGNSSGNVNIVTPSDVRVQCAAAKIDASNSVTVNANVATVRADTNITGDVVVNGNLRVNGDFMNSGAAALGGPGGAPIARKDDSTDGSKITAGSPQHTAT